MWSLEKPDCPYQVVNYKVESDKNISEENKENINCSAFHPNSDSVFAFGTSKGNLKIGDLRNSCIN